MINIPTISELYNEILADLEAEFTINIPLVGRNFLRAIAAVQAAKLKLYYLAIGNLQKNIFVDTADPEARGGTLERFGRVKLGRNPFPAQAAEYEIEVNGDIGAVIAASTTFKSNDDSANPGKLYVLDNAYTLVATTDYITVRALEAGLDSGLNYLDKLTATAPIPNVQSLAAVTLATVPPLAAEDIELYRSRVVASYRLETQGGAPGDYRLWSFDAQGVLRVYPFAASLENATVNLFVEATVADSIDGKGTPSPALLLDVEDVVELDPDTTLDINQRGRRPINVIVNYLPITPLDVEITIVGFIGLTPTIQAAIEAELTAQIAKIRPFVAGADVADEKNDILDVNKIIAIILSVRPGSQFTSVTLKVDAIIVSTYTFTGGDIPSLDLVDYA